jgi:response regulator NasT
VSDTASSCAEARRLIVENDYDVIVINTPLPDEFGHELSLMAASESGAGVILLVKDEIADEVSARVEASGVMVLSKPLGKLLFFQTLRLITTTKRRIQLLQRENVKLQSKIDEIRLIDRAKYTLIEYLSMSEQSAHRFIEKQAMDQRITRREVAEKILKTYEA